MDTVKYLNRINIHSTVKPDIESLHLLHRQHLYNVPFENLDIHSGRKIILEKEKLLHKIIAERRGGFCYELNGAFYELLASIGFNVKRVAAGVYDDSVEPGPDFDHMALIVSINNIDYLADVGFGDSFIEPLKFIPEEVQKDSADYFKISKSENDDYFILLRSSDQNKFIPQYRFTLTSRALKEFNSMCEYHQSSPRSHFTQKVICSKAIENGRITLSDFKFIVTRNKIKEQKVITGTEFNSLLKSHFDISLQNRLVFPRGKEIPADRP